MSGILSVQQEEQLRLERATPQSYDFAEILAVHEDGVTLRFDDGSESQKHYRVNTSCTFTAGMRVYVVKISGSYLVVCPVGAPS